jgi:uncharacterized integral membrane protein (TIGR00697 family)
MQKTIFFKEQADTRISFLSVIYITSLLANLTVGYRYISIGAFVQSGGIFIFPISFIISDIITETYGTDLARKLVIYGILSQIIFALYALLVINLPEPSFLNNPAAYYYVFSSYLYFSLASTFSIWIGSKVNIILLSKLSEYVGGKYFAMRSFVASTAGEFLVTSISMCIANFNKMELNNLIYMILCCFVLKTIISFFAIWPAALVVYSIENPGKLKKLFSIKNIFRPVTILVNLFNTAWNAKGYLYNLESINLDTKKVSVYFKGTRGVVVLNIRTLALDSAIITRMKSIDVSHVGYYYAMIGNLDSNRIAVNDQRKLLESYNLKAGIFNIKAIGRDGKLVIEDSRNLLLFNKFPLDVYQNKKLIENFSTSQALYIGYLAGLSEYTARNLEPTQIKHLKVVR